MTLLCLAVGSVESEVVIVCCLRAFIRLNNDFHRLSWSSAAVDTVLQWIMTDTDDSQFQQVDNSSVHTNTVITLNCCGHCHDTKQ